MYIIVAGGGKVGSNIARSLIEMQREVTIIEQRRDRFAQLEAEFGHSRAESRGRRSSFWP